MSEYRIRDLAARLEKIRYEALPAEIVTKAKAAFRDALGAILAGCGTAEARAAVGAMRALGSTGPSTAVGYPGATSADGAALVNGTSAHACEIDDFGLCGHPGAVVVPALLAAAEAFEIDDGRLLVAAMVAGYEASGRIAEGLGGYRSHTDLGWHSTGTCGGFAASAAVSKLLNRGVDEMAHGIAIAGSYTGATWAFIGDGAMSKRLHAGRSAANGLTAAVLAANGMSGPMELLDDRWGSLLRCFGDPSAVRPARIADDWDDYAIAYAGFKAYACCRGLHYPMDSVRDIMAAFDVMPEDVESITITCNTQQINQFGNRSVESQVDAQFSMPYAVALIAAGFTGTVADFHPNGERHARVLEMMERIRLREDHRRGPHERPLVALATRSGRTLEKQTHVVRGEHQAPMSEADLHSKFVSLAAECVGPEEAEELSRRAMAIDQAGNVPRVLDLLRAIRAPVQAWGTSRRPTHAFSRSN